MSSSLPARSEQDLTPDERRSLEQAHAELRAAVEAYEAFLGEELRPDMDITVMNAEAMRAAQERVDAAEKKLWERRERFLGWTRPPWAHRHARQ